MELQSCLAPFQGLYHGHEAVAHSCSSPPHAQRQVGATFLDTYYATRHAALQPSRHAIRFDANSAFHYFDSGRYLQAQLLLHALRLIDW